MSFRETEGIKILATNVEGESKFGLTGGVLHLISPYLKVDDELYPINRSSVECVALIGKNSMGRLGVATTHALFGHIAGVALSSLQANNLETVFISFKSGAMYVIQCTHEYYDSYLYEATSRRKPNDNELVWIAESYYKK